MASQTSSICVVGRAAITAKDRPDQLRVNIAAFAQLRRSGLIDKVHSFAQITDMDRTTFDLENYRAALGGLTINELVTIGRAQIAAEKSWQSRIERGFADRMIEAAMSREMADLAALQSVFAQRRAAGAPAVLTLVGGQFSPDDIPPPVAVERGRAFLAADEMFRAVQKRTSGTAGPLPHLDERSESVDIVIAYGLKALGAALIALRHREYLSEADFAFLIGPYAAVIGSR